MDPIPETRDPSMSSRSGPPGPLMALEVEDAPPAASLSAGHCKARGAIEWFDMVRTNVGEEGREEGGVDGW